jgi:hypothetical protein
MLLGGVLLIVAAAFYLTQKALTAHPSLTSPAQQPLRDKMSPGTINSPRTLQPPPSEAAEARSENTDRTFSRPLPEPSSLEIADLRKEIVTLEKAMLKEQILMNSLLKSGLIEDRNPETSGSLVSVPGVDRSADETVARQAKDNSNSYVESKAAYLGQKTLWKALKAKLQAAELAQKK